MEKVKKTRAKGAGRKPLPPEERGKVTSIRLTAVQRQRFIALGGVDWLRQQLDRQEDQPRPIKFTPTRKKIFV